MQDELKQLTEQAIGLETRVGQMYQVFAETFPEDADFWGQLVVEESHHAELIRTGVDFFMQAGVFPKDLFPATLQNLQKANQKLLERLEQYTANPPSRTEAFNAALQTERSAGEVHFQRLMENPPSSRVIELFQELNEGDMDHARRIQERMQENGIPEQS